MCVQRKRNDEDFFFNKPDKHLSLTVQWEAIFKAMSLGFLKRIISFKTPIHLHCRSFLISVKLRVGTAESNRFVSKHSFNFLG